jgi:hypothetical protein
VGDYIVKINDTPAESLTLLEAQLEIHESGRRLKLFVKGYDEKLIAEKEIQNSAFFLWTHEHFLL